jgi:hypothetical protein
MIISEPGRSAAESLTLGRHDEFTDTISKVRGMITIAMGCMKELSAQAVMKYKAPGMRFLIGEILSCLGQAKIATGVNHTSFNFKTL